LLVQHVFLRYAAVTSCNATGIQNTPLFSRILSYEILKRSGKYIGNYYTKRFFRELTCQRGHSNL
jgi:hypothetical protein